MLATSIHFAIFRSSICYFAAIETFTPWRQFFANQLQVLKVLIIFVAFFVVHVFSGYRKTHTFIFMCCWLVTSAHWLPAYTKLQLEWFNHGQLHNLPMAAFAQGWLGFLQSNTIVKFAQRLAWFEWHIKIFVIVIKAGCLAGWLFVCLFVCLFVIYATPKNSFAFT